MNEQVTENLKNTNNWQRALFMVLFAVFYSIAEIVLLIVIVFQFLSKLITGTTNERALSFGAQLSTYVFQTFMYLTYNTEERPYPFANWPTASVKAEFQPKHTRRGRPRKTPEAKPVPAKPAKAAPARSRAKKAESADKPTEPDQA